MRGPFPCPAGVRAPPQHEEGPDTVPQHPEEPEPSRGSCSVLGVGALGFTNSRNVLSRTKNDPSCSVHDPFPSLVLLGLVYPRFCCRMLMCHLHVPSALGRGQLQQHLPERRMQCWNIWHLVAAGGFISVHPKSGFGRSGGHWVGAGSGDTSPAVPCPRSCSWGWQLPAPSGCSLLTPLPSTFISSLLGAPSSCLLPLGASNRTETPLEAAPCGRDAAGSGERGSRPAPRPRMCQPSPIRAELPGIPLLSRGGGWE